MIAWKHSENFKARGKTDCNPLPGEVWTFSSKKDTDEQLVLILQTKAGTSNIWVSPLSIDFDFIHEESGDLPVISNEHNQLGYDVFVQSWLKFEITPDKLITRIGKISVDIQKIMDRDFPFETGIDFIDEYRRNLIEKFSKKTASDLSGELNDDLLEDVAGGLNTENDPDKEL